MAESRRLMQCCLPARIGPVDRRPGTEQQLNVLDEADGGRLVERRPARRIDDVQRWSTKDLARRPDNAPDRRRLPPAHNAYENVDGRVAGGGMQDRGPDVVLGGQLRPSRQQVRHHGRLPVPGRHHQRRTAVLVTRVNQRRPKRRRHHRRRRQHPRHTTNRFDAVGQHGMVQGRATPPPRPCGRVDPAVQGADQRRMAARRRVMHRGPPVQRVTRGRVGACRQQDVDDVAVPELDGVQERRVPVLVDDAVVGVVSGRAHDRHPDPVLQRRAHQHANDVGLAVQHGQVQRRATVVRLDVRVGAPLEQRLHNGGLAVVARRVQGRPPGWRWTLDSHPSAATVDSFDENAIGVLAGADLSASSNPHGRTAALAVAIRTAVTNSMAAIATTTGTPNGVRVRLRVARVARSAASHDKVVTSSPDAPARIQQ